MDSANNLLFQEARRLRRIAAGDAFDGVEGEIPINRAEGALVPPGKSDQGDAAPAAHSIGVTIEGRIDKHIAGLEFQAPGIGKLLEFTGEDDGGIGVHVLMSRRLLDEGHTLRSETNDPAVNTRFHATNPQPPQRSRYNME